MEFFEAVANFFTSPLFGAILQLLGIFMVVVWLSSVYWTYRDANARGAWSFYWAVVTLLVPFFGWILYLILRPSEYLMDVQERELEIRAKQAMVNQKEVCPQCKKPVEPDFVICPSCMKKLKNVCQRCGKPLNPAWSVCPYCQAPA